MSSVLFKNAEYVVTLDPKGKVLKGASVLIENNVIKQVGPDIDESAADEVIDVSGMVMYPGFVNTHMHIPQVFHKHCPAQQNKPIADWIRVTTSINKEIDADKMYYGALICFAELMMSGVTTSLDYFYPFVQGKPGTMEAALRAAKDIGIRFTSIRGSMSVSRRHGSLYDEQVVEPLEQILEHSELMISKYHDISPLSMTRIGVGPCLPFASLQEDYSQLAELARRHTGVIMQTHTAESEWEVQYCRDKFGMSPVELMDATGFIGPEVSLTHCNIITKEEVKRLGDTKTNVVLTPICNTRDASDGNGIAPVEELLAVGANVSIGVDGAASNDSLNLQDEMRYLRVVSRGKEGLYWHRGEDQAKYSYRDPLEVLEITNLGGSRTLNRDDIGMLTPGRAADLAIFDPHTELNHAGVLNSWGAIMSCSPIKPKYLYVNGKQIIKDGTFQTIDLPDVVAKFGEAHLDVVAAAQKSLGIDLYDY